MTSWEVGRRDYRDGCVESRRGVPFDENQKVQKVSKYNPVSLIEVPFLQPLK